jgi:hypothetical protein
MAVAKLPAVVSWPHAFTDEGRQYSYAAFLPGETLGRYVERVEMDVAQGRVRVLHNGRDVPVDLWRNLIPRQGDQIIIRSWPEGGGDGSKILRTVALVVVAIVSYGVGVAVGGAYGAAAAAAISIGGSLLVNALIPLPKPNLASSANSTDNAPSFQIQASRNTARPWEPMLLVMGGPVKVVPDLASNPSTSYVGDDQYLSQAFHFGLQPDLLVYNYKIGDSPLENFQGVQTQRSGWDGKLSIVWDNIDTIQGFDLNQVDGWNYRTTPPDTVYFNIELAAVLYSLDTLTGKFNPRTVTVQIHYRDVTGGDWVPLGSYTDPVYATHYWALGVYQGLANGESATSGSEWIQVNYGSLDPDDHVNGEQYQVCQTWGGGDAGDNYSCQTYEWRWLPHPFQLGRPWQGTAPDPLIGYTTSDGYRMTGDSNKAIRQTIGASVPRGQYEIAIRKLTEDLSSNTDSTVTSIPQIRAYQDTPTDYSHQLRVGICIKATSQLNGPIDELSATCQAQCNVWNGSSWVYTTTRNPAWWFLWFALGRRDESGNKEYGACIPDTQIDIEGIKAWGAYCDAKGWTFDYVLAQKMSVHDVLTMIARAGQASYTWQSGKLGVIWDAADQPTVALIGPYNIRAGTFEVSYVDGTVDEIIGNFVNKDRDWQADQVRVRVPNAPLLNNPQTFDLEGIVDAAVAGRVVNLLAASQNFHRRRISWEMDIEGYIATRGDVVRLTHDLTVWGYSGRLVGATRQVDGSGSGTSVILRLSTTVPISSSGWMILRGPENQAVVFRVVGTGNVDEVSLLNPADLDGFPLPGDASYADVSSLDWAWQFDPLAIPGRRLKIVSASPTNDDGVRFEAVDDDPNYYATEANPFVYSPPRDGSLLRGIVMAVFFEESIVSAPMDDIQVRVDWVISAAMRVNIDYRINGVAKPTVTTNDRFFTIQAHTGDVLSVTVTPVSPTGLGVAKSASMTVAGLTAPLPAVTGLTSVFRDGLTWLSWTRVEDRRNPSYEIRIGPTPTNARTVAVTDALESLAVGNGLYWVFPRFAISNGIIIYGPPDSILIDGATLVRNVLVVQDEAPEWGGTLSGGAYVHDGMLTLAPQGDILSLADVLSEQDVLWFGGPAANGSYTNAVSDQVDIGFVTPVRVDFSIEVAARNVTADVFTIPDILAVEDVLNGSDLVKVSVIPQIRTAIAEGEWSDWRNYVPGLINARYFDVRLLIATADPLIIPFVSKFEWTIDVPDMLQRGESVLVASSGQRITYAKQFHHNPNVQITILDAVAGDWYSLTGDDETGFNIRLFNNSTAVQRQINWISQGY